MSRCLSRRKRRKYRRKRLARFEGFCADYKFPMPSGFKDLDDYRQQVKRVTGT